jgi:hypothetical protein
MEEDTDAIEILPDKNTLQVYNRSHSIPAGGASFNLYLYCLRWHLLPSDGRLHDLRDLCIQFWAN